MSLQALLAQILLALGVGFLIANVRLGLELVRWRRRRPDSLIIWPARKPPFYGLSLGIGLVLGLLVLLKSYLAAGQATTMAEWLRTFVGNTFGELMMFVYFGYMLPLSTRISRGLYGQGIWTDTTFMPYEQIGGITWRAGEPPTLLIISRARTVARRLEVPTPSLGEVRRILRDKISSHAIEMDEGPGLHLGVRDARDSV